MVNAENFSRIMKLKNEIVEKAEFARQAIKEKLSEFTGPITRGIANIKSEADKVKNTVYYQIDGAQKVVIFFISDSNVEIFFPSQTLLFANYNKREGVIHLRACLKKRTTYFRACLSKKHHLP